MDYLKSAYHATANTLSKGADYVADKAAGAASTIADAAVVVADKAAGVASATADAAENLYDKASTSLSHVEDKVVSAATSTVQWTGKQLDKAAATADSLYSDARAGLSEVSDHVKDAFKSDDSYLGPLKYANPLFYMGKASEYTGKGLKWVGEKADDATKFYDEEAKGDHNVVTKGVMGVASGLAGFGGSLIGGVGSLVEWGGKMEQGDKKTIESTAQTAKSIGGGLAYIDGKVREGTGKLVEGAGDLVGSDTIKSAGQGYQALGKAEQNLASDTTKKVVDTFGEAGLHYAGRLGEAEGQAVSWVGEQTGSDTLKSVGDSAQQGGQMIQDATKGNALVSKIDQAVSDRGKEYGDNASYAVTRDVTRVTAEIASLIIAPESVLGKAGEAARGAEVVSDTARGLEAANTVARGTEVVSDASRATHVAEGVADAGRGSEVVTDAGRSGRAVERPLSPGPGSEGPRAVGGPEWTETVGRDGSTTRTRQLPDAHGGPAWTERVEAGQTSKTRVVPDETGGPAWTEHDNGGGLNDFRERHVPADDHGPAWREREVHSIDNGQIKTHTTMSREVPATDGGQPWFEVKGSDGQVTATRGATTPPGAQSAKQIRATDGDGPWTEVTHPDGSYTTSREVAAKDGGRNWTEIKAGDGTTRSTRTVPSTDGRPDWWETVQRDATGKEADHMQTRVFQDASNRQWTECINGENRWQMPDGLQAEARARGPVTNLTVEGPNGPHVLEIYGSPDATELQHIKEAFDKIPPAARPHASKIYINDSLGELLDKTTGLPKESIGGLGGGGEVFIRRAELATPEKAEHILYHEMGHVADSAGGVSTARSAGGRFGSGQFVSDYASRNAAEDFAETHRVVLSEWDRLSTQGERSWAREVAAEKKIEILRMYGIEPKLFGSVGKFLDEHLPEWITKRIWS